MQKELTYFNQNLRSYWRMEIANLAIFVLVLILTVITRLAGESSFLAMHTSNATTLIGITIVGVIVILLFGRIHRQNEAMERFRIFMTDEGKHVTPELEPLYAKCRRYYHNGKQLDRINGVIAIGIICGYLLIN